MTWLATAVVRHARLLVAASALFVAVSALFGTSVTEHLTTGGERVPSAESTLAAQQLAQAGQGDPNLIVQVSALHLDSSDSRHAVASIIGILDNQPGVVVVGSAWTGDLDHRNSLRSIDGAAGLIVAHVAGDSPAVQSASRRAAAEISAFDGHTNLAGVTIALGGSGPARAALIDRTDSDLLRAELLALPITVLILLFVFRTPVAAALPLVVATVALVGTMAVLRLVTELTTVSVFARSVASVLALAMAVDMTLFLVARYREARTLGEHADAAVATAVRSAGPSILFSGLTTATSLAALLVFDQPMLRSFAYAGVAAVLLALAGSLIALPAVMTLLGDRIDRWHIPGRSGATEISVRRWQRWTARVLAHRGLAAVTGLAVLVVVASPVLRLDFGLNDDRVLPADSEARMVNDDIRAHYAGVASGAITIVYTDAASPHDPAYLGRVRGVDGVVRAAELDGAIVVTPGVEPVSPAGRELVERLRALDPPVSTSVLIGGEAARFVDSTDHVKANVGVAAAAMLLASFVLVGAATRSPVVAIKAVVLNLASLAAMFGAIVWIFQDGRGADLLGYTPTGLTDITVPMLMFCVAFGLSMDYEVYLVSRIREEYERHGDNDRAIIGGLGRTGGILSASAVLMSVVFLAFATAGWPT